MIAHYIVFWFWIMTPCSFVAA